MRKLKIVVFLLFMATARGYTFYFEGPSLEWVQKWTMDSYFGCLHDGEVKWTEVKELPKGEVSRRP